LDFRHHEYASPRACASLPASYDPAFARRLFSCRNRINSGSRSQAKYRTTYERTNRSSSISRDPSTWLCPRTKPDLGLRREVQASDRRGAAIVDAVRGLRHARRERDTWCGSSTDRRPGRAGWRRLRREPNQQIAAPSTGRVRLGALSRQAPALALAAGAQPQAAVSGRPGGDEGWRATAPALCRRRRSSRCPAPEPPRRPSRPAVALRWGAQQRRNFFLEFYDRFGALQPLLQPEVLPPRKRKFHRQRVWFGGFGTALGGA